MKLKLTTQIALAAAAGVLAVAGAAPAVAGVAEGRRLADDRCGDCHRIESQMRSPNPQAPSFLRLATPHSATEVRDILGGQGFFMGHPTMPSFHFEPSEVEDIMAFLRSQGVRFSQPVPQDPAP